MGLYSNSDLPPPPSLFLVLRLAPALALPALLFVVWVLVPAPLPAIIEPPPSGVIVATLSGPPTLPHFFLVPVFAPVLALNPLLLAALLLLALLPALLQPLLGILRVVDTETAVTQNYSGRQDEDGKAKKKSFRFGHHAGRLLQRSLQSPG